MGSGRATLHCARQPTRFFTTVNEVHVTVARALLDGDQEAVEWTWTETRRADDLTHSTKDAIIFVLREGQIVFWREYIDTRVSRLPLQPASS